MNRKDRLTNLIKTKGRNCNGIKQAGKVKAGPCNACSKELYYTCDKVLGYSEQDRMNQAMEELDKIDPRLLKELLMEVLL